MTAQQRRDDALRTIAPFVEQARTFSGWSFDDLDVTPLAPGPPWDYTAIAREHARRARDICDHGTGGGEVLSRIIESMDARVVATEEWHVNAPVARDRLRPLGVHVVRADSLRPPFADASFDLVLSRHEAIDPAEIARELRPGGWFITQQVAQRNWHELDAFIGPRKDFGDHLSAYSGGLRDAGFAVEAREHEWPLAYRSLGEVAFMLLLTPEEFPAFDPEKDIDALLALEAAHGSAAGIVLTAHRYLIEACKPG